MVAVGRSSGPHEKEGDKGSDRSPHHNRVKSTTPRRTSRQAQRTNLTRSQSLTPARYAHRRSGVGRVPKAEPGREGVSWTGGDEVWAVEGGARAAGERTHGVEKKVSRGDFDQRGEE